LVILKVFFVKLNETKGVERSVVVQSPFDMLFWRQNPFVVIILFEDPLALLLLSVFKALLIDKDVSVLSEVWDIVVSWISSSWLGCFPGQQWLSLSVSLNLEQVSVLERLWIPVMNTEVCLCLSHMFLSDGNISVDSEIWDGV
jgi:hypothetical protein